MTQDPALDVTQPAVRVVRMVRLTASTSDSTRGSSRSAGCTPTAWGVSNEGNHRAPPNKLLMLPCWKSKRSEGAEMSAETDESRERQDRLNRNTNRKRNGKVVTTELLKWRSL